MLVRGGMQLQQAGDLDQAESLYRKVLATAPNHPDALHLLGLLKHQRRNSGEAIEFIERAIIAQPGIAEFHNNLGEAYRAVGKFAEAISQYDRALELAPHFAEALVNRGVAQRSIGDLAAAEKSYLAAIARRPDMRQAHANLGNLLRAQSRFSEAEAAYKQAIGGGKTDAEICNDLGVMLLENGDTEQALKHLNRARELDPHNAELLSNIGIAYERQRDTPAAIAMYRQAIERGPASPTIFRNLGLALYNLRELEQSIEAYERGLALSPQDPDLHVNLAFSLFSSGDLPRAWKEYGWRAKQETESPRSRAFQAQPWKGEDISGKSLLVWGEQGVGDELWLAGMVPDLLQRLGNAGRLVLECSPKLQGLLQRSFPGATVVAFQNPPHAATWGLALQAAAGNLGGHLRNSFSDFPRRSRYLSADGNRVLHWKAKFAALGPGLKVGICWRSNNASGRRAEAVTAISKWGEVLRVPEVDFINLQYDECQAELSSAQALFGTRIRHFDDVDMYDDLDETAALTAALDLVISAPTSVSVMAPALGVPTWQLNYIEDWRAFGQSSNPWFPSLRTWNRPWNENWEQVLSRVAAELRVLARRVQPSEAGVDTELTEGASKA